MKRWIAAAFLSASLASVPAAATDGLPVAFLAEVRVADVLVVGRVSSIRSEWTGRWVETEATIETDEGPVAVRTIGGEVGGLGTWVAGAARFERGTDVAVLAVRTASGLQPTAGERSVVRVDEPDGPTAADVSRTVRWMR
jgi:hypothetical protein